MTPQSLHDFFLAAASAAGALIGLLFVAVSIAHDRLTNETSGLIHRIRASAALTAFTNALAIALFALLPDGSLGTTSTVVGLLGLAFVSASLLTVVRHLRFSRLRDLTFLVFLTSVCVQEVIAGQLFNHSRHVGDAEWLAILVICSFLIGIQRSWELIGGPDIGLSREVFSMVRELELPRAGEPSEESPPVASSPLADPGSDEPRPPSSTGG